MLFSGVLGLRLRNHCELNFHSLCLRSQDIFSVHIQVHTNTVDQVRKICQALPFF